MERVVEKLKWMKGVVFQFMFVLHHNSITNKHLLLLVQLIQIFPAVYFYLNPIYSHLRKFYFFQAFFQSIWTEIFVFTHSQQYLLVLMLMSVFSTIVIGLICMKLIVGYQYLIIVAIELWLLAYPVFFIKFGIETFNILIGFSSFTGIGVLMAAVHTLGSVMALHMYDKKHKMIDLLPILMIHINANQYAVLSAVIVRLILSYFLAPNTLIKPLRIRVESALLIVILFSYFASDNLTNYIAFILLLSVFLLTQVLAIAENYHSDQSIFYHLENLNQEQSQSRLKYYDFVEQHRIKCENITCTCRHLGQYKNDQQIQSKGYQFIKQLYSFKEDFHSRIQLGAISCQQYEYTLSGLLLLLELKPDSIYQQYLLYYIKTKYEQEYRKQDKNYTFGQEYHNAYEDLRSFEQRIETLTRILKEFWNTILYFDGSKKFLALILNISEQITQIKLMYDLYIDKYEEFATQFKYLYKTFEIAILNLLDKENQDSQNTFGVVKQEIQIKIPERILFFISNLQQKIVNCNREFCNLVEIDKQGLINKSYSNFIPDNCSQHHSSWVKHWYQNYDREEQAKQNIKTIRLSSNYMKAVKMQNKILPRFDTGIQIITFIKLINKLEISSLHKSSTESGRQQNGDTENTQIETFFSFLIEKKTMKIIGMDDSFFYTTMIDESDKLRIKILELRLNEIFPKLLISDKEKQGVAVVSQSQRQVMLNYSVLEEFVESKERSNMLTTLQGMSRNNMTLGGQKKLVSGIESQQQRSSYAKKTLNRHTMFGMTMAGNTGIKDNSQQVFIYQVVDQVNSGLETQYCIVNFKLKKNIVLDMEAKLREQKSLNSKVLQEKANSRLKSHSHEQPIHNQEHARLLHKEESGTGSLFANLSHREPFIRSSKPYKQEDRGEEIENKKAELEESEEFGEQEKNYCLPWPILLCLFTVHFLYTQMSDAYSGTFLYLQKTFDFYDRYGLEILKQLSVPLDYGSYQQDLKSLWMQGYGFYHSSILTFENPADPYFVDQLYNQVINEYHFGIYNQIHTSLQEQISQVNITLYVVIAVLSVFMLYVLVDFGLNLRYCFKISGKVTEIILIFLNISQTDIHRLIFAISKYQTEVLEIVSFADIEREKKIEQESYHIDHPSNLQAAQLSGIGLLKQDHECFNIQANLNNLDSFGGSPPQNHLSPKEQLSDLQPVQIVPKINQPHKRNSSLHRRRSSRSQRMDFQKLKQSIKNLRSPPSEQTSQKNILLPIHKRHNSISKSPFSNNTSLNQSEVNHIIQFPQNHIIDQIEQEDFELSPEEQYKISKINNFKKRSRGKINDIRENPRSYALLLIVLFLTVGVLVTVLVLIPRFIGNFQTFSEVYFGLRKLKIVLFKEMIEKTTMIPLQPSVKVSVYSQVFYNEVQEKLNELENFHNFWKTVYSNDVCPHLSDAAIKISCEGLDIRMTSFGQKIMIQYLQDLLRRKNSTQLFHTSSKDAVQFITISKIQSALVSQGDRNMNTEMIQYLEKAANLELTAAGVGTVIFMLCLLLSNKALKDIRLKIKDGENLLLVMPENIKKKYIEQMKKNRMKQLTKQLNQEQNKRRGKKKKTKKLNKQNKYSEQPEQTAVELMGNNSSLIKQEDRLLKKSLKDSSISVGLHQNSSIGEVLAGHNKKPSKFKQ